MNCKVGFVHTESRQYGWPQLLVLGLRVAPVPVSPPGDIPDLVVTAPSVNDSGPGCRSDVHPVGDGAKRRR